MKIKKVKKAIKLLKTIVKDNKVQLPTYEMVEMFGL